MFYPVYALSTGYHVSTQGHATKEAAKALAALASAGWSFMRPCGVLKLKEGVSRDALR